MEALINYTISGCLEKKHFRGDKRKGRKKKKRGGGELKIYLQTILRYTRLCSTEMVINYTTLLVYYRSNTMTIVCAILYSIELSIIIAILYSIKITIVYNVTHISRLYTFPSTSYQTYTTRPYLLFSSPYLNTYTKPLPTPFIPLPKHTLSA